MPKDFGSGDKLRLGKKQRRRLRRLNRKQKRGVELNEKQENRLGRLRGKRQENKFYNQFGNPAAMRGEVQAAGFQANQQATRQNPDQYNPFGNQTTTIDPETGKARVDTNFSQANQQILDQGQNLHLQGLNQSNQMMQGYQPFNFQQQGYQPFQFNSPEEREKVEGAIFDKLTGQLDQNYENDRTSKEQELHNKGIPYNADPKSRYQQELADVDRRYDEAKNNARATAIQQGGAELQRSYGMGLGTHQQGMGDMAQFYNQGLGQHQQGMSDMGAFQGFGTGLMLPQFQGFNAPQYGINSPVGVHQGYTGLNQSQQSIDNQHSLGLQQMAIAAQNANTNANLANAQANALNQQNQNDIYE